MPRDNLIVKTDFRGRASAFGSFVLYFSLVLFTTPLASQVQWDEESEKQKDSEVALNAIEQASRELDTNVAVDVEPGIGATEPEPGALDPESELLTPNVIDLLVRLQRLENELLQAYGRVEELEHQVQTMRHEQRDRFLAIDRRLRELSGEVTISADALATAGAGTEAGMYRVAFSALESKEYQSSKESFEAMIERYPNGKHVPDAFYWLGELNLQIEPRDLEEARQNFVQLVNLYPTHVKAPEAMFQLGTVYHELGDITRALEYLDRVIKDYPDVSVAQLAKDYAANLR